jgi:hypothetical protein
MVVCICVFKGAGEEKRQVWCRGSMKDINVGHALVECCRGVSLGKEGKLDAVVECHELELGRGKAGSRGLLVGNDPLSREIPCKRSVLGVKSRDSRRLYKRANPLVGAGR